LEDIKMKKSIAIIALALTFGIVGAVGEANAQVVVTEKPVPPMKRKPMAAKHKKGFVWKSGHWMWSPKAKKYIWKDGSWMKPKAGHKWISGHWVVVPGKGHRWVPGHWKK
jgi:hypothetical protein